jgi:hypothetical protein
MTRTHSHIALHHFLKYGVMVNLLAYYLRLHLLLDLILNLFVAEFVQDSIILPDYEVALCSCADKHVLLLAKEIIVGLLMILAVNSMISQPDRFKLTNFIQGCDTHCLLRSEIPKFAVDI